MSLLSALGWLDTPGLSHRGAACRHPVGVADRPHLPYIQAVQTAQAIARGERPAVDLHLYGLGHRGQPSVPGHPRRAGPAGRRHPPGDEGPPRRPGGPRLQPGRRHAPRHARAGGRLLHLQRHRGRHRRRRRRRACVWPTSTSTPTTATESRPPSTRIPRVLTISIHESGPLPLPRHRRRRPRWAPARAWAPASTSPSRPMPATSPSCMAYDGSSSRQCGPTPPTSSSPRQGATPTTPIPSPTWPRRWPSIPNWRRACTSLSTKSARGGGSSLGGGGYDPADVTPRAWTAFFGTVLGRQVEDVAAPSRVEAGVTSPRRPARRRTCSTTPEPGPRSLRASAFIRSLDEIEAGALAVLRDRFAGT